MGSRVHVFGKGLAHNGTPGSDFDVLEIDLQTQWVIDSNIGGTKFKLFNISIDDLLGLREAMEKLIEHRRMDESRKYWLHH